jgi:hypothetical protein
MNALEVFDRCMSNKPYTTDFKIYSKKYLQKVVKELEQIDEFEKCIELVKFIEKRFNHELNYLISEV